MAVSYVSRPFRSSPYVLPLDLGLFERVMATKQKQFDIGAAKTQDQIDKLGMLDVLKGEDRQYLNNKINNLVSGINGFGGVDFSDPATLSQIEGLGADIYGDQNILTAISSTKSARNLINSYQEYKTNPKLSKLYSEVNEAYDMDKVAKWMGDGQVGSSYNGPAVATPYTPYRDNHVKMFEKIKADLVESIDDKGLYILKETKERVTPERVMAMAADLLTPQERSQMKRDAWHLYTVQGRLAPQSIIAKSMEDYSIKLGQEEAVLKDYQQQVAASVNDPLEREKYLKLQANQANKVNALKASQKTAVNAAVQRYKEDPEEFMYQTYSNEYFRGLATRFSVNRTQRSIQFDQAEMFTMKMTEDARQFKIKTGLEEEKLNLEAVKAGLYRYVDPETGRSTYVPYGQAPGGGGLSSTNINTQDPDGLSVSEQTLVESNNGLLMEKDRVARDWFNTLIAKRPDLGIEVPAQFGTGTTRRLLGQDVIESFNDQPGLQVDDLALLTDQGPKGRQANAALKNAGMSGLQIEYLKTLYGNYKAMTQGNSASVPDLPEGFADLVEKNKMIDERIRANKVKMKAVNEAVGEKVGFSPKEAQLWADYATDPQKYMIPVQTASGTDYQLDSRIEDMKRRIQEAGVNVIKLKDDYYKAVSTRDVYRTKTFSNDDVYIKNGQLQKVLKDNILAKRATGVLGSSVPDGEDVDVKGITPLNMGMAADGSGSYYVVADVKTGSGADEKTRTLRINIDDKNAQALGLYRDPYEHLNYSVNLIGRSDDLPVYGSKNLSVVVNVVKKNTNDPNNYESFAQAKIYYLDNNGKVAGQTLAEIPATTGKVPSEAYALAKQAVQAAAKAGVTYDQFKNYLYNYKK